eukprot:346342-Chlamydomonas_euryale.AAC.1
MLAHLRALQRVAAGTAVGGSSGEACIQDGVQDGVLTCSGTGLARTFRTHPGWMQDGCRTHVGRM